MGQFPRQPLFTEVIGHNEKTGSVLAALPVSNAA
jgi:hypothetical protein